MGKIKTPIVRPLRNQGGTLYTFSSAVEDIGLNINENKNRVRLSHYAVLDIPNGDEISGDYSDRHMNDLGNVNTPISSADDVYVNKFNVYSMPGAMWERLTNSDDNSNVSLFQDPRQAIAQSFMSYALNMETVIRNSGKYDYTTSLSVSERIFWKWLKETGAIRWQKSAIDNYFEEGDAEKHEKYSNVVKAFGAIDSVSQRSSDYGMYNEVFVNIPSSFGKFEHVLFKQVQDENYKLGKTFITKFSDCLENFNPEDSNKELTSAGLVNIPFFDDKSDISEEFKEKYFINRYWHEGDKNVAVLNSENYGYYIIDSSTTDVATDLINDVISVKAINSSSNNINYTFMRSKLDCMSLELSLENLGADSYDELAIGDDNLDSHDYEFNTILLYYSIYDNNNNILATNLYGVYFLDAPIDLNSAAQALTFELPRLNKQQSSGEGFGTSYSFRINIRTSNIYDNTDAILYDNGSSENSLVSDFNNVIHNLNNSIELLSKHVKLTDKISNEYNNVNALLIDTRDRLQLAENNINDLLFNELNDVVFNDVATKTISVDDNIKFSTKLDIIDADENKIIELENDNIKFNKNVDADYINVDNIDINTINVKGDISVGTEFILKNENSNIFSVYGTDHNNVYIDVSNNIIKSNSLYYKTDNTNDNNSQEVNDAAATDNAASSLLNSLYIYPADASKLQCKLNYDQVANAAYGIISDNNSGYYLDLQSVIWALVANYNKTFMNDSRILALENKVKELENKISKNHPTNEITDVTE